MEGNVIERRPTSGQQNWFDHKQQSYSNIFVTPPTDQERKLAEAERGESSIGKIVIKDRHEGKQNQSLFIKRIDIFLSYNCLYYVQ